jgi:hypothetical protein
MTDAWELLEQVMDETGETRTSFLHAALQAAQSPDSPVAATAADIAELSAVALSQLAYSGDAPLGDAVEAVARAESVGKPGWPNYHLAEAAVKSGDYQLALGRLPRVPAGFFEDQDLNWRAVRGLELEAIARGKLGDWARVSELVDELAAAYSTRGDADDLAPPRELVSALLADPMNGTRLLTRLAASLDDLDVWLGPTLASEVRAALG